MKGEKIKECKQIVAGMVILAGLVSVQGTVAVAAGDATSNLIWSKQNDPEFRNYIQETYDVYNLSSENNVDPEELTDAIIAGIYSEKFSPFSEIADVECEDGDVVDQPALCAEHTYYNQDSTAYLATGNAGASGTMPWIGSCAVHRASSSSRRPLIPFGTTVYYLDSTVTIGGQSYNSFVVNDTGDANFNRSLYWTDVYFGDNTQSNRTAALTYGVQHVQLYFIDS